MTVNENTVFFSLLLGIIPGILLAFLSVWKNKCNKKTFLFIPDFIFAFVCFVVTYIGAIPLTYGRVRFLQVVLELISMLTTFFVFEPIASILLFLPEKIKNCQKRIQNKRLNR